MWLITYLFYVRKNLKTFENSKYAYRIFNFGFNTFIETIPFRKWCFEKYLWKLMLTKFCKRSMLAEFIWIWNNENKKLKRNQKIRIDRISKRRLPTKIVCKNKWKFKRIKMTKCIESLKLYLGINKTLFVCLVTWY